MSALLAQATASFTYQDAHVTLSCGSPEELIGALAKFGIASNQATIAPAPTAAPVADKPKATPAPTAAPQAQPEGNAASTATPASAPAASGGSAPSEGERIDYKVVQAKVLALTKIPVKGREIALATLGKFTGMSGAPVDHGNKLKLEDYPAFVKAADEALAAAGVAA